ncbi:unnamed protein product [Notodromas monacha]|uniref:EndoU domain-containing protein n=1 Tax=Notodromas monacha TaxID=399045 RepID=A0A7R9GHR2_9CRUS|nr:unnamed protein product [Notodromas monacha]CAG0923079.1 unnamed protein product [Notodromas monacha]
MWFDPYCRNASALSAVTRLHADEQCTEGSSGFEHVFIMEYTDTLSAGIHGWVFFNMEEHLGGFNYYGYLGTQEIPGKGVMLEIVSDWNGHLKPITGFFSGASPELELALFSACFILRPGELVNITLAGEFLQLQTVVESYDNKDLVHTAYFVLEK